MKNAIVLATRRYEKTLSIMCPWCDRHHGHGAGGERRLNHGHRLAHCVDSHLPKPLRGQSLGYFLVCLDGVAMTARDFHRLISDMDARADAMREERGRVLEDFQMEFRRLQQARHPDLTEPQWSDLFDVWKDN